MGAAQFRQRIRGHPHLFQLIEFADLGPEKMNDDIIRIDQNPIAGFLAFDTRRLAEAGFQAFQQFVRDSCNMPRAATGCDDHMIGHRRTAAQINGDDIFGQIIRKGFQYQIKHLLGGR